MGEKLKPKEFFSEARITEIRGEIRELENQLRAMDGKETSSDGVGYMQHASRHIEDEKQLKVEIANYKRALEDGTPKPFKTTAQANQAYAWAKKAEKWIKENMPLQKEMHRNYPTGKSPEGAEFDFERSVKKQMAWQKEGQKHAMMYRYLMRRLDPENPEAGSIERLRQR